MIVSGYPIIFNSLSVDLGNFRERILPQAVDRTLRTNADVVALFGHDVNKVIARRSAGTLTLTKDSRGLLVHATVDESISFVGDLVRVLHRGEAPGGSFAFRVPDGGDVWSLDRNDMPLREVIHMSISEVSAGVCFPAYQGTALEARAQGAHESNVGRRRSIAWAARELALLKAR